LKCFRMLRGDATAGSAGKSCPRMWMSVTSYLQFGGNMWFNLRLTQSLTYLDG